NQASPVSRVRRSASASIHASIRTRPSSASWTIAARSSGCIAKGDAEVAQLVAKRDEPGRILMEDRREERGLRNLERRCDVPGVAGAARGDDRQRHSVAQQRELLEVVA